MIGCRRKTSSVSSSRCSTPCRRAWRPPLVPTPRSGAKPSGVKGQGRQHFLSAPATVVEALNVRDVAMGRSTCFGSHARFIRGARSSVWAATLPLHAEPPTCRYALRLLKSGPTPPTMGHVVSQALGSEAYAVGFTAFEGVYGTPSAPVLADAPPKASLEDIFGARRGSRMPSRSAPHPGGRGMAERAAAFAARSATGR